MLLVHPGGPYWARKDLGAWSIPKGELDADEDPRAGALREFAEETGTVLPAGALAELGAVKLKSGKQVIAFAVAGDLDPAAIVQQHVRARVAAALGRMQAFPEIDRAEWFGLDAARGEAQPRAGRVRRPAGGAARALSGVPGVGVEPTRPLGQSGLNRPRLPITPPGRGSGIVVLAG